MATIDPCARCVLPDCDDRSERCQLRRLKRLHDNKRRQGRLDLVTEEERFAANAIFRTWKLEVLAKRSEGLR